MENASKALIMAASILISIMVLTIGVTLFRSLSDFGHTTYEKVESERLEQWNNTYLKYSGTMITEVNGEEIVYPVPVTAHDIITLANHARQNNLTNEIQDLKGYDPNTLYVQIDTTNQRNIEKLSETGKNNFLKNNSLNSNSETKYYKCITKYEDIINPNTRRVMHMEFEEFTEKEYMALSLGSRK